MLAYLHLWLPQLLAVTLLVSNLASTQILDPIEIYGSKFFFSGNGTQFFIRGVIYQQVPSDDEQGSVATNLARASADDLYVDPLSDAASCQRDIPYLQKLQTNVVRSYGIDPSNNHSQCLGELADAGIYVLVDLPAPGLTIGNNNPVWNDALYDRYTQVIDAMHNFTNLLGFVVGDNVVQGIGQDDAGPYVKAAVRDMKAYIRQKDYRAIPVGYVSDIIQGNSDVIDPVSKDAWQYLNCGNPNETIDFFGGNAVSFCKGSSYTSSGYSNATGELSNYSIPTFLAGYGCSNGRERDFDEIKPIYSHTMTSVWSGGIIYEYFQQGPDPGYGLVSVAGSEVSILSNFADVSSNMAKVTPTGTSSASYRPSNTAASCPEAGATQLPPNPRAAVVSAGTSGSSSSPSASGSSQLSQPSATGSPQLLHPASGGLSTGAKAGIGVGVAVLVLVLAAILLVFFRRKKAEAKRKGGASQSDQWNKTELAADSVDREARGYNHMAASSPRAEIEGAMIDPEVAADRPIVEAPEDSGVRTEMPTKLDSVSAPTETSP